MRVGYMSQAFSLYGELTVAAEPLAARAAVSSGSRDRGRGHESMSWSSGLASGDTSTNFPKSVPLGVRQRLSLAVAVIHEPGNADPRRTDVRRRPRGTRRILGVAHRYVAAEAGDDIHLDPLHERGHALRPDLADARGHGAGLRHAVGSDGGPRDRRVWKRRSLTTSPTPRARRRPTRRDADDPGGRAVALPPTGTASATPGSGVASESRPSAGLQLSRDAGDPAAIRCGWPLRSSVRWS